MRNGFRLIGGECFAGYTDPYLNENPSDDLDFLKFILKLRYLGLDANSKHS